jgi:hypothetical protein
MTEDRTYGKRLVLGLVFAALIAEGLTGTAGAGAATTYSTKTGRVPNSERVRTTLHISNDTTVVPAPKKTVVRISQRAALLAASDSRPVHADGRTFYPSVLFGLVTNSVMQSVCNIPGLSIPGPGLTTPTNASTTPTTACHKGLFYQGTPVWVITQHGACIGPTGGGVAAPGATTTTAPGGTTTTAQPTTTTTIDPARCVLYTFVSAKTGKYLYAEG